LVKRRKTQIFPELFPPEIAKGKGIDLEQKLDETTDNLGDVLSLIAKCERLVKTLNNNNLEEASSEVLSYLAKLKNVLLTIFKKKQRKLLDLHWEQMRQESKEHTRRATVQEEEHKKTHENQCVAKKTEK
jgi:hypothetical protein